MKITIQIYGNPNMQLINWIKVNRDNFIFILYTCRHDEELQNAIDYLKENYNIEFDYINENVKELIDQYGDTRKIYADYYIDDKNIAIKKINKISLERLAKCTIDKKPEILKNTLF